MFHSLGYKKVSTSLQPFDPGSKPRWYTSYHDAASLPVIEFGATDISDQFSVSGVRGEVAPLETHESCNVIGA